MFLSYRVNQSGLSYFIIHLSCLALIDRPSLGRELEHCPCKTCFDIHPNQGGGLVCDNPQRLHYLTIIVTRFKTIPALYKLLRFFFQLPICTERLHTSTSQFLAAEWKVACTCIYPVYLRYIRCHFRLRMYNVHKLCACDGLYEKWQAHWRMVRNMSQTNWVSAIFRYTAMDEAVLFVQRIGS